MEQKTPEQKAEERYRMPSEQNSGFDWYDDECDRAERRRQGYVACYREEVEPRDRILQELVDGIEEVRKINADLVSRGPMDTAAGHCLRVSKAALAKAKEQFGIEPSKP